jgi:hypothetical protein
MAEQQDIVNFNAHLSSLVKNELVNKSNISAGNYSWFFKIIFPDILQLNGVELVVPLSMKKWPHYVYDEIFSCINAQYPEITSPSFNGDSYRLEIYLEGKYLSTNTLRLHDPTKDLPNGATVGLRYWPLKELSYLIKAQSERGVVSGIEKYTDADYDKAATLQKAAEDAAGKPHAPPQAYVEGDAIDKAEITDAATAADAAAAAAVDGPPLQRAATAAAAAYAHALLASNKARAAMDAAGNAADAAEFYSARVARAADATAAAADATAAADAAADARVAAAAARVAAAAANDHAIAATAAAAPAAAAYAELDEDGDVGDDAAADAAYAAWKANPAVVAMKSAEYAAETATNADNDAVEAATYASDAAVAAADARVAAAPAPAAPAPAVAAPADAAPAPPAPVDPFPPILHPASRTMMTYDHKQRKYVEPILNGTSGKWMVYDPKYSRYSEPLEPWSGGPPTPGTATQGPPPMVYPNTGEQTGPFKYGGKKPQSKRGKKKSKSKTKTKKSKSKSKRNKRRSYKRVK